MEARRAASEVATSAEARRAMARARHAVKALGDAATAATALIRAAWRTSGGRARAFGQSREFRVLQNNARRAAERAAATALAAGTAAGERAAATWERAVSGGKDLVSRAEDSVKRTGRRLRAASWKK
jgi:hypothetical protein